MTEIAVAAYSWSFYSTLLGITKYSGGLFVCLLLETTLVLLDVTCGGVYEVMVEKMGTEIHTTDFLLTIATDGTEDGVLLAR